MECKGLKLIPLHRSPLASARGGRCIALPPASFNSGRFSAYEPVVITSTVPGRPFAVCWIRPLKFSSLQLGCIGAPPVLFESLGCGAGLVDVEKLSSRPDIRVLDAMEVSLEFFVSEDAQGEKCDKRWCETDITPSRRGLLERAVLLSADGCYVVKGDILAISLEGRTVLFVIQSIPKSTSKDQDSRTTDKNMEEAMERQFNNLTVVPSTESKQVEVEGQNKDEGRNNPSSITLEERLRTFYEKYNPSKIADAASLAIKYAGREEEVFAHLQQKYHVAEVGKVQTSVDIDIVLDSSSSADDTSLSARFVWLVGNDTKIRIKWGGARESEANGSVRMNPSKKEFSSYFLNIGGLDTQISELKDAVLLPLLKPELFLSLGVRPPRGILLHGPPGTGKTTLADAVTRACGFHVVIVHGSNLTSRAIGDGEAALRRYFDDAASRAPAVILMDEIDTAFPSREAMGGSESDRRLVSTLLSLLDGCCANSETETVIVIACTNQPQALDPALRRPGRLDKEIEIGVPDEKGREQILSVLLSQVPHLLSANDIAKVASQAHGFVGADLHLLVKEATLIALRRIRSESDQSVGFMLCAEDIMASLRIVSPSGLRQVAVEVPTVRWDDIGGQDWVKQLLKEVAEWPLTHPEAFERMGITPPRGVLLYGPPGCSKTLMARALATESGMNFLAVKGPELLSKWLGESERALQALYRRARLAAPTIIFFDEIDAIAGRRGGESGASTATERVLSQLLTELDGIQPLKRVITVAATNRPDMIDPALLRPGRLDRLVYVPPPDLTSRRRIFEIGLRSMPTTSNINLNMLAEDAEGLSGAEVIGVCREAALGAIEENKDCVEQGHILAALKKVTPLITPEMLRFYDQFSTHGQKEVGPCTSVI